MYILTACVRRGGCTQQEAHCDGEQQKRDVFRERHGGPSREASWSSFLPATESSAQEKGGGSSVTKMCVYSEHK